MTAGGEHLNPPSDLEKNEKKHRTLKKGATPTTQRRIQLLQLTRVCLYKLGNMPLVSIQICVGFEEMAFGILIDIRAHHSRRERMGHRTFRKASSVRN